MIRKLYFEKKINLSAMLKGYHDIYQIQSEVKKSAVYGIDGDQFAIILSDGAVTCSIGEIPQLASMLKSEAMRQEVLDVLEEVRDLRRMELVS